MTFNFKNNIFLNTSKFLNLNISLIPYIYRKLEDDTSDTSNQTSISDSKKQQLKELYIYINNNNNFSRICFI